MSISPVIFAPLRDGRKLVLDLVALDGAMLRNDFLEESAQRWNVPLPVVEIVEQLALSVLRIRSKRLVKVTARRDHTEIPVEHEGCSSSEGLGRAKSSIS
jgi:hypothetical protein